MEKLKSFFNWLWLCITTFFTGLWDTIVAYSKAAGFKGVVKNVWRGVKHFFTWRYAIYALATLMAVYIAEFKSAFVGWVLLISCLLILLINLHKNKKEKAVPESNIATFTDNEIKG